jgi:hypothetical protein
MNPLVAVGAVALLGFLATMRGRKAEAAPSILPPFVPAPMPMPGPAPAPVLSASMTSSNINVITR